MPSPRPQPPKGEVPRAWMARPPLQWTPESPGRGRGSGRDPVAPSPAAEAQRKARDLYGRGV